MRDFSKILAILHDIEASIPVDRLTYRGVRVWPLIRHNIASQLFWENGTGAGNREVFLRERALVGSHRAAPAGHEAAVRHARELEERLADVGASQLMLLTIGFEYTELQGRHYNRFYDPLKSILFEKGVSCQEFLVGFQENLYPNSFTPKRVIERELQLAHAAFRGPGPGELISGFEGLLDALVARGLNVSAHHGQYRERMENIIAWASCFELILERVRPALAFIVCYYHDTAMAFLLACSRKGVPSVEMQHSVVSPNDWGWAGWTRMPETGYELLPRYFWAWGESFAAVCQGAAPNIVPVNGGNVWIPVWKRFFAGPPRLRSAQAERSPVALYAAPIGDLAAFEHIFPEILLEAIRLSPPSLRWIIRVHYKTDDRLMRAMRDYLTERVGEVSLHRASEIQLYHLFENVDYHVSQTCTTVIEAEEFGVPNIIIGAEGGRWFREEIEKGYYLHAETPQEVVNLMTRGEVPTPRPAPLLQTDPEAAWRELAALLKPDRPHPGEAMQQAPHIFTIETTLACDLRCPECAIGSGIIKREKGLMSFADYRLIADKIRPYASYVYLHIWGEPMLNPDIFEMIRYTAGFAGTNISTNGQCMTREKAQALIASGVTDVIVSIDGVTQEVYGKYRVGGEVAKAFAALTMLVQENRSQGGRTNIIPQFIVFEHNQHEMEAFAARCRELGLAPSFKAPYIRRDDSRFNYCGNPAFQRPHFPDLPSLQGAMSECPNPREVFTVLNDGSVVACCHDYSGATCFGNIFRQEVMEIWESAGCCAFRGAVTAGRAPDFCVKNCMTWFLDKPAPAVQEEPPRLVNLCCGPILLPGFINIDAMPGGDLQIDLERELLPFPDASIDALICISAINYFSYQRGREIVADVHRVLKPGGIARFATQDLRLLARRYLERDSDFYFQTLSDGRQRFPGETYCDKLNAFFYGFYSGDKHCKYVYDPESLTVHLSAAGFARIEEKGFGESAIPGAGRFDNRPDQMFFLEAVKEVAATVPDSFESRYQRILRQKEQQMDQAADSPASFRERGAALLPENPERGWQLLLKALELDPADRQATLACAAILDKLERLGDLMKLYGAYLAAVPGDAEMAARAREALPRAEAQQAELKAATTSQSRLLAPLVQRKNRLLADLEHLNAGIAWLGRAQDANPAGGVSAIYYLESKSWDVDYPETTGYIIPTFLAHYRLTGDESSRDRAIRMGEWEVDIQAPEGGAGEPYGVYGLRPRVFNTGQVLLGYVSLYRETGNRLFLDAAMRAGDWILSCLDSEGKWSRGVYRGPRSYKSRVAWALLELAEVSAEQRYRTGARRAVEWILGQAEENGFFRENSLTEPGKPWTHLIGYVHVGLLEACRFPEAAFDREQTLRLLRNAALALAENYLQRKSGTPDGEVTVFPATFDSSWQSRDNWSCITGNAQIEFFLRRMLPHLDDPRLSQAADGMLDDLKRLQMIDGITCADLYGALPGAYPLAAPYCTYSIPNWGVKFFADSLLQRLLPAGKLDCIG